MKLQHACVLLLLCLSACASFLPQVTIIPVAVPPQPTATPLKENPSLISQKTVNSLTEIGTFPVDNIFRISWLTDSSSLVVITQKKIILLKIPSLKVQQEFNLPENASLMDFNPASQKLAVTIDRQILSIRDLSGKEITAIKPTGGFGSAGFNPDGSRIVVSSLEEFKAVSFDTTSGRVISSCDGFETAAPVYSVSPSPQGRWLIWLARATVQLSNPMTCKAVTHIGHEDFVISHAFNKDESILATSTGGTLKGEFVPLVYLWNTSTGLLEGNILLKQAPARGLSFSLDGSLLATAGNGLSVWDATTGKDVKMLASTDQVYNAVAFSPDGTFLAAATETGLRLFAVRP